MTHLKCEKGFSLSEVLVAAGLLGILSLGMNYGIEVLNKQKKNTSTKLSIQSLLNLGLKYTTAHSNGLSWKSFDYENTYFQGNNMRNLNLVNWNHSDIDSISSRGDLEQTIDAGRFGNVNFYVDSFTLVKEKGGTNGLYFSRCVSATDYKDRDFTLQEALDLPRRPYLVKKNEKIQIHCSTKNASGSQSSSTRISGRRSDYRVVSFYYKNNTWKQIPSFSERKYLLGAGYMIFMNRNKNPDSFIAYNFILDDPCYRYSKEKNCNRLPIVQLRNLSGPIQETGVHDSGFMIIQ